MKKAIRISLSVILIIVIILLIFVFTKGYRVSKEDSYTQYNGFPDLYKASREELIGLDMCNYQGVFGEVKTEKDAFKIAAKVIKEVYGNDEYPYIVKYNENANAWIVSGSLPKFSVGGVAAIAIDKDTGEVLMLFHED